MHARQKTWTVAIGKLERFVADYEIAHDLFKPPLIKRERNEKVAIIALVRRDSPVPLNLQNLVIRSPSLKHACSWRCIKYGIPEFRLPRKILIWKRIELKKLGVKIEKNFLVDEPLLLMNCLTGGISAIFLGTGAGTPQFMENSGWESQRCIFCERIPDTR